MVKLKGQKSELPQKKRRRKIRRFFYDFFSYDSEETIQRKLKKRRQWVILSDKRAAYDDYAGKFGETNGVSL